MEDLREEVVEVVIEPGGKITYTVKGVKGTDCGELTKFLDQLGEAVLVEHTAEYYEQDDRVTVTL